MNSFTLRQAEFSASFGGMGRRAAKGFTLIEILVAFTILGLLFGALMRVFSGGLQAAHHGENYTRAVLLAESKLAQIVHAPAGFEAGETSGTTQRDDGRVQFSWQSNLQPYVGDEHGGVEEGLTVEPWVASVDVSWEDGGRSRTVTLTSMTLKVPK